MVGILTFEAELEKLDRDLARLREMDPSGRDIEQVTSLVYRLYQRASLTGNLEEFDTAETAIDQALAQVGPWPDICLLKANLDFKFHRLAETKRDLDMAPGLAQSFHGRVLLADVDLQEGRYEQARLAYESLIEEDRTWDNLARLAFWKSKFGETAEAEVLYREAEDEITAKDLRSYAWVQLQRGLLHLRQGLYQEAMTHYRRAEKAYPGYWLVDDHIAELLGAQGDYQQAADLYESVLARTPRPELQQAYGELFAAMGDEARAGHWFDRARAGYLASAERGGVHYYHHLVDFYSDAREDGAEAVRWALQDIELRRSYATEAALAWAYYRNGQIPEAVPMIERALASGIRDAHLFWQAETIFTAAGLMETGELMRSRALALNPRHQAFHVHRA